MGCWDVYCFLCGFPCHNSDAYSYFLENKEKYEELLKNPKEYKSKKNKWFIDEFKKYYEIYKKKPTIMNNFKKLYDTTKWMNNCTFLTNTNEVIHGCEETTCNVTFCHKDKCYTHDINNYPQYHTLNLSGIFVHTDCWNVIYNKYKFKITYDCLPINPINSEDRDKIFNFINYGIIEGYWEQFFDFTKLIFDNNYKLLDKNIINKNVIKNFNKLKIRYKSKNRPGPMCSASFYDKGNIKLGSSGKFWIIKNGKWTEIKENIINKTITISNKLAYNNKFLKSLRFIGEVTDIPVVIKSIDYKIKKNKIININLITTEEYEKIIDKKI